MDFLQNLIFPQNDFLNRWNAVLTTLLVKRQKNAYFFSRKPQLEKKLDASKEKYISLYLQLDSRMQIGQILKKLLLRSKTKFHSKFIKWKGNKISFRKLLNSQNVPLGSTVQFWQTYWNVSLESRIL